MNHAYLHVLGADGLAATTVPATAVMERVLGPLGSTLTAAAIAVSTLGFLSQAMLTAPRVYYTMAEDGLFFRAVARVSGRSRAPVAAIVLQGAWAAAIAFSGRYEQILNYVVSVDFLFIGLTGSCVFAFRRQDGAAAVPFRAPGHPIVTILFTGACWLVVANTVFHNPKETGIGLLILLAGLPAYAYWRRSARP